MKEYYFLAGLLPPIEIGRVPSLGYSELQELLRINLEPEELARVHAFLRLIDFENMRALWSNEPFDRRGNVHSPEEMEQALLNREWPNREEFPLYLQDYLDKYQSVSDRLKHFPYLMTLFFNHEIETQEGFLNAIFQFYREFRLVLLGFRAKKVGKDPTAELQYEDSSDPIVAQILAQKDAKVYEPPFEYRDLKPIFDEYGNNPIELHRALTEYQFKYIVENWGTELFSIERILNYLARLILVERWLELDVQKGMEVIDMIEKDVK